MVIGLAVIGFAAGATVRLKVLILLLVTLFAGSIIISAGYGLSFAEATLKIVATQVAVQTSYFIGSLARAVLARVGGGSFEL